MWFLFIKLVIKWVWTIVDQCPCCLCFLKYMRKSRIKDCMITLYCILFYMITNLDSGIKAFFMALITLIDHLSERGHGGLGGRQGSNWTVLWLFQGFWHCSLWIISVVMNRLLHIEFTGQQIEEVWETKSLGVILDNSLAWKPHIQHVRNKVSRGTGILIKTATICQYRHHLGSIPFLSIPILLIEFKFWGKRTKVTLIASQDFRNQWFELQLGFALNLIQNPYFYRLKILRFTDVGNDIIGIFMYKVYHQDIREYLKIIILRTTTFMIAHQTSWSY